MVNREKVWKEDENYYDIFQSIANIRVKKCKRTGKNMKKITDILYCFSIFPNSLIITLYMMLKTSFWEKVLGGLGLSEDWTVVGSLGGELEKGREGEQWFESKMNRKFKIKRKKVKLTNKCRSLKKSKYKLKASNTQWNSVNKSI